MTAQEKVRLIERSKRYKFKRIDDNMTESYGYEVEDKEHNVAAFISDAGDIRYFRTKCERAEADWLEIDIHALLDLTEFSNLMKGE